MNILIFAAYVAIVAIGIVVSVTILCFGYHLIGTWADLSIYGESNRNPSEPRPAGPSQPAPEKPSNHE